MKKLKKSIIHETVSISRKNLLFASACLLLIILKHMIAAQLPITPRTNYRTDDHLMVMMARNIMMGKWLGPYSYAVLMKGCFFPLFLSAAHLSGISYLSALDLVNSAAALYFTLQLRNVLRKRRWMLILFTVLLFNPINTGDWTFQRVYRCSISNMQALFLFGALIGEYLDKEDRFWRQFARASFCGFWLWASWNTREDVIWMLPFVIAASGVMLFLRLKKQRNLSGILRAVILCAMPFVLMEAGNGVISALNQKYYGLPIRNEASAGFGKMLKTMYSIKNKKEQDYVTVSSEKLQRMYAVSPTLKKIEPELAGFIQQVDSGSDRFPGDGEAEDGWLYWCIRRAVEQSGVAPTLPEADAFYRQVDQELQAAINMPDSPFETKWTMPSPLMSPWRDGYLGRLFESIYLAGKYMVEFEEITAHPKRIVEPKDERMSFLFEGITGNAALHREEEFVQFYREIYMDRAEFITLVYHRSNLIIAGISALLFLILTLRIFIRKTWDEVPWLLVTAGLILSVLVLVTGIAYTDMTAFTGIVYTYIAGGYALLLAFEWLTILRSADLVCCFAGKRISAVWKKKKSN